MSKVDSTPTRRVTAASISQMIRVRCWRVMLLQYIVLRFEAVNADFTGDYLCHIPFNHAHIESSFHD